MSDDSTDLVKFAFVYPTLGVCILAGFLFAPKATTIVFLLMGLFLAFFGNPWKKTDESRLEDCRKKLLEWGNDRACWKLDKRC